MYIVDFPWYDFENIEPHLNKFWSVFRQKLLHAGFEEHLLPKNPCREIHFAEQWSAPNLLISQACGFDVVTTYKDQLQLSLKRNAGNRGFIRVLFPKVKTYLSQEKEKVKCSLQLEWIGIIMLIAAIGTLIAQYTLPEIEGDSIPKWAPAALIAWYLFYTFSSMARIKKAIKQAV